MEGRCTAIAMPKPESFLVACDIGTSKICVLIGEQNARRSPRRDRQGRVPPTGVPVRATSSTSTPRSRPSSGPPKRRKSWPGCRFPGPGSAFPALTCGPSTAGAWSPCPARTGRSPRRTSTRVIDAARGVQIPPGPRGRARPASGFRGGRPGRRGRPGRHDRQPPRGRRPRRHGARRRDAEHRDLHEQGRHRGRPAGPRAVRRGRGGPHAGREGARDLPRSTSGEAPPRSRSTRRGRSRIPRWSRSAATTSPTISPSSCGLRSRMPSGLKKKYGCALRSAVSEDEMVEVPMVGGRAPKLCPRTDARPTSSSRAPRSCSA